jgi:hypothetical protein
MTLFDLLFIALFLTMIGTLVAAAFAALRGRRAAALTHLRRAGLGLAGYFAILLIVSVATPQRIAHIGDEQCSDDWCIAVAGVKSGTPTSNSAKYEVRFRISSRAQRATQRELGVVAYIVDEAGQRFTAAASPQEPPFDVRLLPLGAVDTTRIYNVPAGAKVTGLEFSRTGFPFPGCCIIGDENSLLHRKTVVRLD